ncbi:uncharacterized protein MEPE_00386 [Melanopsichium pennsylvanicum]|uniref:Uncharacterized protein n=2 Tax=Melanopsichium pennsylvanicum TaxID=63383 RepID=A0AAJ4XGK6_9BASI|nr:hypothetical protein BN887_03357 [Melanopsichium pennsylvanicum 4]SNX81681.1 uncharacterized protein MEPE_00386 [Melanopsichium pennsylvanicum]
MAQLPPYLVRIVASMLTQALTRKLANSPLFFRIVDRMIHEIDHMPHRVQGRQVPPYQAPLGMRENEWERVDHGEPHDEPSPFPSATKKDAKDGKSGGENVSFEEAQRRRARMSYQQSQRLAQRDRARAQEKQKQMQSQTVSNELRELQEKLRELRNKP